ncbi:MAG: hypothetical protein KDC79_08625 [Cyclobacteriaceae bacterium]|nr:hypothetical protein [Cyclobacteriaceae bacterium]
MVRYIIICLLITVGAGYAQNNQPSDIPDWLLKEWESRTQDSGLWIADNSKYKSENEPYDAYGMKWEYGIGKKVVKGRLFVIKEGKDIGTLWEFLLFWDPAEKKAIIQQFGSDGTFGSGEISLESQHMSKSLQTFSSPAGIQFKTGHKSDYSNQEYIKTTSYSILEDGSWSENRVYYWKSKTDS